MAFFSNAFFCYFAQFFVCFEMSLQKLVKSSISLQQAVACNKSRFVAQTFKGVKTCICDLNVIVTPLTYRGFHSNVPRQFRISSPRFEEKKEGGFFNKIKTFISGEEKVI